MAKLVMTFARAAVMVGMVVLGALKPVRTTTRSPRWAV